jgi:hypothetical protein
MRSAIRVIIRNPLYTGFVRWNASQFVRNPDTEKVIRRARPKSEWITHQDDDVRFISDELFERAQRRIRQSTNNDERLKSGGKAKYLLVAYSSAKCAERTTSSPMRVAMPAQVIGMEESVRTASVFVAIPSSASCLPRFAPSCSPDRCKQMAKEMHSAYAEHVKANVQQVETMPQAAAALDARLERLCERLKTYGEQISLGLDGDPQAAAKARPIVPELLGGKVELMPGEDGSLWAEYGLHMTALLQGARTCGRGEELHAVPAFAMWIRVH